MISPSLKRGTLVIAACILLAACAGTPRLGGDPALAVVTARELPAPAGAQFAAGARPYLVGPFDRLTIDVFGIEELQGREVQVDAAGRISFPLVGVIDVAGRSPGDIEQLISDQLRDAFIRDPQVTVNLKEAVSQIVTIDGRVKKPGLYPVMGRLTLMGIIAKAEGTEEYSNLDDVVIFRTVDGQRFAALYDLDGIRHGAFPDPELFPNDVVTVGDNQSRRLFKDLLTTFSLVSGPLVITMDRVVK